MPGFEKISENPKLWILVADGKQAEFYEYREEERIAPAGTAGPAQFSYKKEITAPVLEHLPDLSLRAEPIDTYKVKPSEHGPSDGSIPSHRHTRTPHGDLREEIKEKFAREIAAHLEKASINKRFGRLVLAAPPRVIGKLRPLLNQHIRKKLAAEISENLTRLSPHELLEHLKKHAPKSLK